MPSIFTQDDVDDLTGYIFDEHDGKHHEKHIHVYRSDGECAEFYFNGEIMSGNVKIFTKKQKKQLRQWMETHQDYLEEK